MCVRHACDVSRLGKPNIFTRKVLGLSFFFSFSLSFFLYVCLSIFLFFFLSFAFFIILFFPSTPYYFPSIYPLFGLCYCTTLFSSAHSSMKIAPCPKKHQPALWLDKTPMSLADWPSACLFGSAQTDPGYALQTASLLAARPLLGFTATFRDPWPLPRRPAPPEWCNLSGSDTGRWAPTATPPRKNK